MMLLLRFSFTTLVSLMSLPTSCFSLPRNNPILPRGNRLEQHLTKRLPTLTDREPRRPLPISMISSRPLGMVPSPSDHLPVQDLIEVPNKQHDPRPQDMNSRRLKKILGAHFDKSHMSVSEPKELATNMFEAIRADIKRRPALSRDLRQLDKTVLAGGYQLRMRMRQKQRQKVKRFLQAYSHCPVQHRWKDLGERFWPRWIKESRCYVGRSCSIPKGMSCQPHESTNLTLLRWFCPAWDKRRRCSWIQIQYPIVTSCKCAC